jgi:hypothetical protein
MAWIAIPCHATDEATRWWASGGAEMMDELAPAGETEPTPEMIEAGVVPYNRVAHVSDETMARWIRRAEKLPGWESTGIQVVWR